MTLERDGFKGPYVLECDVKGCHEILETHCFNFEGARAKWRSRGWMAHYNPEKDVWVHLCPEHEEELKVGSLDESEIQA